MLLFPDGHAEIFSHPETIKLMVVYVPNEVDELKFEQELESGFHLPPEFKEVFYRGGHFCKVTGQPDDTTVESRTDFVANAVVTVAEAMKCALKSLTPKGLS